MSSDTIHAKYSASATHRWFACPGSVRLSEGIPDISKPWADDGREAHTLLEFCLMGGIRNAAQGHAGGKFFFEYRKDTYEARMESVQEALDYVYSILDRYADAELHLEVTFQFPSKLAPGEAFGTADIVILVRSIGYIFVLDFKHGAGVAVDAEANTQLKTYGTGALNEFDPSAEIFNMACLVIMQPRAFHKAGPIREWYLNTYELLEFVDEFDKRVEATQAFNAPLVIGEDQCQFCKAKPICPAREAQALAGLGHFQNIRDVTPQRLPAPQALSLERITYILLAKKMVIDFFESVEQQAFELAMSGIHIPDYKLVDSKPKRTWDDNREEIAEQLMLYLGTDDLDEVTPRRLVTVTEAERKLKAHFRSQIGGKGRSQGNAAAEAAGKIMAEWTTKQSSGKLSLAHSSDQRPAVDRASRDLGSVKTIELKANQG